MPTDKQAYKVKKGDIVLSDGRVYPVTHTTINRKGGMFQDVQISIDDPKSPGCIYIQMPGQEPIKTFSRQEIVMDAKEAIRE